MNKFYTLAMGLVCLIGVLTLCKALARDFDLYQQESACVSKYIKANYERSEIATGDGKCWIKI